MNELTPEMEALIASKMMENRPHLIELENRIQGISFGHLEVIIDIRNSRVDKMTFIEKKACIREKSDLTQNLK